MKLAALLGGVLLLGAAAACGMGEAAAPEGTTTPPPMGDGAEGGAATTQDLSVTFHRDVEPILQTHCQGCHVTGGIAPMPLITYADAQSFSDLMKQKTGAKLMPPWGAQSTDACKPRFGWKNDPTLSDAQIATIGTWADNGAPEGDPKDAPPAITAAPIDLANATDKLKPAAPFSLAGSTDQFRCFVFDPKITQTMYMNGSHVLPGNPTIVHHVVMFSVPGGVSAITQKLDASGSYDCFGGPGVEPSNMVAVWAPGGLPSEFPSNVGIPLSAGTALVMQIHYHPHTTATAAPDATTFEMRLTPNKPEYFIDPVLVGNSRKPVVNGTGLLPDPDDRNGTVEFRIPANSASHTETMQFKLPSAIALAKPRIYGIGAHMHLVGVGEQVTLKRAAPDAQNPADECLLGVPEWNFNWQRRYDYATDLGTLPAVSGGDVITVKCNYNNTMQNPAVATSVLAQQLKSPSDVFLGETTLDEMCLAPIDFIYKAP
jgi:hypothetical protein